MEINLQRYSLAKIKTIRKRNHNYTYNNLLSYTACNRHDIYVYKKNL